MKILTSLALIAAVTAVGCEQQPSKLDKITAKSPKDGRPGAAPSSAAKIDRTGSVEDRLARLEDAYDKNAEALEFLNKVYGQQKQQQQAQEREEPAEGAMFAVDVSGAIKAGQVDGPATAPVTIVKAFDFACPYCEQVSGTLEELVKESGGKVRVVYTNMLVHQPAKDAHLASCAAAKQGKYNEFKHTFWEKGFNAYKESRGDASKLAEPAILGMVKDIGIDADKLKTDMHSKECEDRVKADMEELRKFHVNATPTFFINGKHYGGALPKTEFKRIIDEELKAVEASGVPAGEYYDKVVIAKGEKQFRSKVDPKPN